MSANKMLHDCGYNSNLINDMRKGKMPSADKIMTIAQYLEVSAEYLMGVEKIPELPELETTKESKIKIEVAELIVEYGKMSDKKRRQLVEYAKFLKMQEEFAEELGEVGEDLSEKLSKSQLEQHEK